MLALYDVAIEVQWLAFVGGGGLLFLVLYRWVRADPLRAGSRIRVAAMRGTRVVGEHVEQGQA